MVGFHLALPAATFDPFAADLLYRDVLSDNQIHTGDDGSTFLDVRDPDGNMVKIMRMV